MPVAWTANYAFRVCDQCETFRLFVDILLVVIPRQGVLAAGLAVPDGRRDVYVIPNARFSILLFEKAALFVGWGGGIGRFTESGRMTTGEANSNAQRSTRPVLSFVDIDIALRDHRDATVHHILGTPRVLRTGQSDA